MSLPAKFWNLLSFMSGAASVVSNTLDSELRPMRGQCSQPVSHLKLWPALPLGVCSSCETFPDIFSNDHRVWLF